MLYDWPGLNPSIGHLKGEHPMDRNRLKNTLGDCFNAILSTAGMKFRRLPRWTDNFTTFLHQVVILSEKHGPRNISLKFTFSGPTK
jgi:hypothetical protein